MINKKNEQVKKVEELKNFPFKNFAEYKKAFNQGIAYPGIDRSYALRWAQGGIYCPKSLQIQAVILAILPFVAMIGVLIYCIIVRNWWMLLSLPALFICTFIFHPSSAFIFGFIRTALIWASFIGLVWAFFASNQWLFVLTLALIAIWYGQTRVYQKAINKLSAATLEHEDLLCIFWQIKGLRIGFFNGDSYWADWQEVSGKITQHEKD